MGSAAALTPDDVVFAQYRETGVFQQRGFTLKNFMSQLFANDNDTGKGRNMPVHYGQHYPRIVRPLPFDNMPNRQANKSQSTPFPPLWPPRSLKLQAQRTP